MEIEKVEKEFIKPSNNVIRTIDNQQAVQY